MRSLSRSGTRSSTRPSGTAVRRGLAALLAGALALTVVAVALAAHPKKGASFAGVISTESPVNGFPAPVKFAVSANGKTLTAFKYSTFGCFGAGGFRPGIDYYTKPGSVIKVGTVKVSGSSFSVSGAVSSYTAFGYTTKTTTAVHGSFTSPTSAAGTIVFSQKESGKYTSQCGPATLAFTAKAG
jgi:hypothetical protein